LSSRLKILYQIIRDLVPVLYEKKRVDMLKLSDAIACVSPYATECVRSYCSAMDGSDLASKVRMVPHPVNPIFTYAGETKENCVVAVGRWDANGASQKNPELLMEVLTEFLAARPDWNARIVGKGVDELAHNYAGKKGKMAGGIEFINFVDHAELKSVYVTSRIMLCVSRHESFHISSAEAVCCGCSVVVPQRASLGSTAWFTNSDSGRIAERYDAKCIVKTLKKEADCWNSGLRNPAYITKSWVHRLRAGAVASSMLKNMIA
jgi:glycosyltransferase involved in cell wall biosynthesis